MLNQSRQLEPGLSAEFLCHYCDTKDFRSNSSRFRHAEPSPPVQDLEQVTYLEIQAEATLTAPSTTSQHR